MSDILREYFCCELITRISCALIMSRCSAHHGHCDKFPTNKHTLLLYNFSSSIVDNPDSRLFIKFKFEVWPLINEAMFLCELWDGLVQRPSRRPMEPKCNCIYHVDNPLSLTTFFFVTFSKRDARGLIRDELRQKYVSLNWKFIRRVIYWCHRRSKLEILWAWAVTKYPRDSFARFRYAAAQMNSQRLSV